MSTKPEALASFLAEPSRIGTEISVTGKWLPTRAGGWFWTSDETREMRQEWADVHAEAKAFEGVLATEIHHAVGEEAVLVHHVFRDAQAMVEYFQVVASPHAEAMKRVARPDIHLVRGLKVPLAARQAIQAMGVPVSVAEHRFGYVKQDYLKPDPASSIFVTAKWTCTPGAEGGLEALTHWWQQVGTEAHSLEAGLIRYEVYEVEGEDALIIHEVFEDTAELRFHLSRGTAEKYKKHIDQVAVPECYFFRGPVSWDIRTYSKFLSLPATYSSLARQHTSSGGTLSDGLVLP